MTTSGPYADDLALALRLADAADIVTLEGFGNPSLTVDAKSDSTPVTEIDRAAEKTIRETVEHDLPDDAIIGEEYGTTGGGPRQWVIDPIDGTKNYIRGIPVWASLIALLIEGDPVVGVVSAPALRMRWFASREGGAWKGQDPRGASRIRVSTVDSLKDASLSYSSLHGWERSGLLDRFLDLQRLMGRTRAFGDFFSYMLVAEGAVEVATEPSLALYDMAALVPIVVEAGGRFTSLAGDQGPSGGNALATNGLLHDEVLAQLGNQTR